MSKNKKRPEVASSNEIQSEIPVDSVSHAPWNPRTAEELKPNHPAMASLIDSVRALGIVQPMTGSMRIRKYIGETTAFTTRDSCGTSWNPEMFPTNSGERF